MSEIVFTTGECSLGAVLIARSARGVCAILLGDHPDELVSELKARFSQAEPARGDGAFEQLVSQVIQMIESPGKGPDLILDIRGTTFQQRVWQALREIPAGATATYRDIATRIGSPGSVRAVAQACAANSLAVAIPCHRVIRSNGELSGYRWGLQRKRTLLDREAIT